MDYAPNYSQRYVVKYVHAGAEHSFTVRKPRGAAVSHPGVTSKLAVFLSTLAPIMFADLSVLDVTFYAEDAFVGIPVYLGDLSENVGDLSASGMVPLYKAIQLRFECKGNAGSRNSLSIFGCNLVNIDGTSELRDFRITSAEYAQVGAAITALNELSPAFVPMGSTLSVWRSYANLKFNDYWVHQLRG